MCKGCKVAAILGLERGVEGEYRLFGTGGVGSDGKVVDREGVADCHTFLKFEAGYAETVGRRAGGVNADVIVGVAVNLNGSLEIEDVVARALGKGRNRYQRPDHGGGILGCAEADFEHVLLGNEPILAHREFHTVGFARFQGYSRGDEPVVV